MAVTDFFAGSDLDMTTAVGPGDATGSGGTNYDDGGGALFAGIDKYGMLITDYWARAADAAEEDLDITYPSANITIGIDTTIPDNPNIDPNNPVISGTFRNVLFGDARPTSTFSAKKPLPTRT